MNKVFTVPNVISMFRLLLIPVFVIMYFADTVESHFVYAVVIIVVAGISDIADGVIARKFSLITPLGKILDPLADKLMQATVLVCLSIDHSGVIPMTVVLFVKEIFMAVAGLMFFAKQNKPYSSRWWGKLSTSLIIFTVALVIFADIVSFVPAWLVTAFIWISVASMVFSLAAYIFYYFKIISSTKAKTEQDN